MKAFIKFNKGLMWMPRHWQLWLGSLMIVNGIIPFLFLDRLEAQVVLAAMVVNMILMTTVTAMTGFSRLLGLGHLPWLFLLLFLWSRLSEIPMDDFFGFWIRVLIALNAVSLVIDAIDVARYLSGDREETVQGL